MDLWTPINIYCERLDPSFWAEPINAITNAAFLLAAAWGYGQARRNAVLDGPLMVLIGLTAIIGVGSFLFHTFAVRWAALADVIPIGIFTLTYFYFALRRFFGFSRRQMGLSALGFAGLVILLRLVIPGVDTEGNRLLNGSLQYAPAFITLILVAGGLVIRRHPARYLLISGAGLFLLSLTFRTIDPAVCDRFPLGTHFLWHSLNGVMIALLLQGLAVAGRRSARTMSERQL
ncbi:MAG: ceramidase domain-containing protein [Magnetospiraceae bacterium]